MPDDPLVTVEVPATGLTFTCPQSAFTALWSQPPYEYELGAADDGDPYYSNPIMQVATAAGWTAEGTVMELGTFGIESDTGKMKVGDGATAWADLDYVFPSDAAFESALAALAAVTDFAGDETIVVLQDGELKTVLLSEVVATASPNHASDSFDRADNASSLGTTDNFDGGLQDLAWTQAGGTGAIGITSNKAVRQSGTGLRYATVDVSSAVHGVRATISDGGGSVERLRLVVRYAGATQHYLCYYNAVGWQLARMNPTVANIGTTYNTAVANGDTLELRANGNTIELLHNGVVVKTADESATIAATPALGTNDSAGFALHAYFTPFFSDVVITNAAAVTFGQIVTVVEAYTTEVVGLRDDVATLTTLVGDPALRADWIDPITGLVYKAMTYATPATPDSIQAAIDAFDADPDVDEVNRAMVLVPPGTYTLTAKLLCRNGVDVRGATGDPADVVLIYTGNGDVCEAGGVNTLLASMTMDYQGAFTMYALHVDTDPGALTGVELVVMSMKLISRQKMGMGCGSRDGQGIYVYDTELRFDDAAGDTDKGAFFWHNDASGIAPAVLVLDGCTFVAEGGVAPCVALTQYDNGQDDKVYMRGGSITKAAGGTDLTIVSSPAGVQSWVDFYIDPTLYSSGVYTDAGSLATSVGLALPAPTRMPARIL